MKTNTKYLNSKIPINLLQYLYINRDILKYSLKLSQQFLIFI